MGKDPAVLLYPDHLMGGMRYMSMEDRGRYITLLCDQFLSGHIPENHMISVCESKDSPVMKKFEKDENGLYYNKRMKLEMEKRARYCKSRSNEKSGRKKKNHMKTVRKSYENHTVNVNVNVNKDINIFENVRLLYPGTKRGLKTEFDNFKKKHKDWKIILPTLEGHIKRQMEERKKINGFVPQWKHFQTYINNRSWEEEFINQEKSKKPSLWDEI